MDEQGANITTETHTVSRWAMVALGLLFIAVFVQLGYLELSGEEPRRATVALEMLEADQYIVPHAYGLEYYNKPPLHNWFIALAIQIFGVNEFAVRIPGLLAYFLMALTLWYWLRDHGWLSILAPMILLASADWMYYATVYSGEIDLLFSLFLFLNAIGLYFVGLDPIKNRRYYFLAYAALVAALLTKGLLAFHFHFLAVIVWTIYTKTWKKQFNLVHALAFFMMIGSLVLYYYAYSLGGDIQTLYSNQFVESQSKVVSSGAKALLNQLVETPLSILKISLPWTFVLLFLYQKRVRAAISKRPMVLFSILYILSNLWIYWLFVDVRDRYLYPFIPFVCVIIAGVILHKKWWPKYKKVFASIVFIMIFARLLMSVFIWPVMSSDKEEMTYRQLSDSIVFHCQGEPIGLLTPQEEFVVPMTDQANTIIKRQPVVPYQLGFYLGQKLGRTPKFTTEPVSGEYYLIFEDQYGLSQKSTPIFRFTENWYNKKMVLIKWN